MELLYVFLQYKIIEQMKKILFFIPFLFFSSCQTIDFVDIEEDVGEETKGSVDVDISELKFIKPPYSIYLFDADGKGQIINKNITESEKKLQFEAPQGDWQLKLIAGIQTIYSPSFSGVYYQMQGDVSEFYSGLLPIAIREGKNAFVIPVERDVSKIKIKLKNVNTFAGQIIIRNIPLNIHHNGAVSGEGIQINYNLNTDQEKLTLAPYIEEQRILYFDINAVLDGVHINKTVSFNVAFKRNKIYEFTLNKSAEVVNISIQNWKEENSNDIPNIPRV